MSGFIDDFNAQEGQVIMDELGDDVTFIPSGGGAASIIKSAFTRVYYETESGSETASPAVECLITDVPNYKDGNISYGGTVYDIVRGEPDGKGMIVLVLRSAD
ncbi:MAG: hypothetical protein GQ468_05385 [Candidatus Scalindua sp.]|nr:hypothetical protein [Candidatus Scalindua sp.]